MKLTTALQMLKSDPVNFLGHNLVSIAGHNQSGVRMYYFGYHDNFAANHNTNEGFKFGAQRAVVQSAKVGLDHMSTTALQVHNLRMIPNAEDFDVSSIEAYVLGAGGPDLMVTGQLSACVLAVQTIPGGLVVAHIQPGGARQTGTTLRQTIKLMGRFNGYGRVTHVFGPGVDYPMRAHVIGIRTGGTWHLYAQKVAAGRGPVTGAVQIV